MPQANALTFLNLQDAVLGRRFPAASQRTNAKRWLATAYTDVWNALRPENRLWSFELVFRSSLAVTAGDPTPTMPPDYADTFTLYDQDGEPLTRLSPEEFEFEFADAADNAAPYAFTVVNRQIHLGPTPDGAATFTHTYRRRLAHRESDEVTVSAGFMDEDSDYPLWDDHHGVLIPRAVAIGLMELNDPTWEQMQAEFERQLSRMRDDYEHTQPQAQWAADVWW